MNALLLRQIENLKKYIVTRSNLVNKLKDFLISTSISYFVACFLDRIIFEGKREIRLSGGVISIDRPEGMNDLLLYYFVIAVFVGFIYLLFISASKNLAKIKQQIFLKLFVSLPLIAFIIAALIYLMPVPKVDPVNEISGYVKEKGRYCYLFIRPIINDKCWLQRPSPLQINQNGVWRTVAYFGGAAGERFEVIAIAAKKELNSNLFPEQGKYSCNLIPRDVDKFVRIVEMK